MQTSRVLLIAAQLLLAVIYTVPTFNSHLPQDSDFVSFYTGWSIVRNGEGHKLYDLDLQAGYQASVFGLKGAPFSYRLLPFINPPHAALLFMPFAYLPLNSAANVFLILNCILAGWILRRLWDYSAGWPSTSRILLVTTAMGCEVLWYGLVTRTMTLIVLVSLIEYFVALKNKQDFRAAIWLFVATLKPQLILLPALIPLAQCRWRIVTITAVLGLVASVVISLILGFEIWFGYFQILREVSAHGELYGASVVSMNNLRMVLHSFIPKTALLSVVYIALLCGAIGTFWFWRTARHFEMRFAITVILGLLLAPHLNYQDTLLAFLPAVLGYEQVRNQRPRLASAIRLCVLIVTFVPAALIFSGSRILRWIWPVPVMLVLLVVASLAFERHHDERKD